MMAGILNEKLLVGRMAVRVEVAVGLDHHIRIGPSVDHIQRRHVKGTDHPAAFAAVDDLRLIPDPLPHTVPGTQREEAEVGRVRIIQKADIGVGVTRAHPARGLAHTLQRHFSGGDELGLFARHGREFRITGAVDRNAATHHTACAVGHDHHHAGEPVVLHHHPADHRSIPDLGPALPVLAAVPLGLALGKDRPGLFHAPVNIQREAHAVPEIVAADKPVGLYAAHLMNIFADQGPRTMTRGRDSGGRPAGARPRDQHIALSQNRQFTRLDPDCAGGVPQIGRQIAGMFADRDSAALRIRTPPCTHALRCRALFRQPCGRRADPLTQGHQITGPHQVLDRWPRDVRHRPQNKQKRRASRLKRIQIKRVNPGPGRPYSGLAPNEVGRKQRKRIR